MNPDFEGYKKDVTKNQKIITDDQIHKKRDVTKTKKRI